MARREGVCYFRPIMELAPALLATVRLRNRGDIYLVVDVDPAREMVELISITGKQQHLVPDVPICSIHELVDGPPDYL